MVSRGAGIEGMAGRESHMAENEGHGRGAGSNLVVRGGESGGKHLLGA